MGTFRLPFLPSSVAVLTVCTAAVIAYHNSFRAPFLFDDIPGIVRNPAIQQFDDVRRILTCYTPPRPLLALSYALNYAVGGLRPAGYHAVNLTLHALTGILVYLLVRGLSARVARDAGGGASRRASGIGLLAGLFFVLHPVQTDAVTYVWGRSDVLCAFFSILAVVLYLQASQRFGVGSAAGRRSTWLGGGLYAVALLAFAAALGSKATGVLVPGALPLVEMSSRGSFRGRRRLSQAVGRLAPFLLLALARVGFQASHWLWKVSRIPGHESPIRFVPPWPEGLTWTTNALSQIATLGTYMRLLLVPVGLNADHDFPVMHSPLQFPVLAGLGLLLALIALAVLCYSRAGLVSFGVCWFLLFLGLYAVVPLPDLLVERRLYLPGVGFSLVLAIAVGNLAASRRWILRGGGIFMAMGILTTYTVLTVQRNTVWSDPLRLWSDTVRKSPGKERPLVSLATVYQERGWHTRAIAESEKTLGLFPASGSAFHNLLSATCALGAYEQAVRDFGRMLRASPNYAVQWYVENAAQLGQSKPLFDRVIDQVARESRPTGASGDLNAALGLIGVFSGDGNRGLFHLEKALDRGMTNFDKWQVRTIVKRLRSQREAQAGARDGSEAGAIPAPTDARGIKGIKSVQ